MKLSTIATCRLFLLASLTQLLVEHVKLVNSTEQDKVNGRSRRSYGWPYRAESYPKRYGLRTRYHYRKHHSYPFRSSYRLHTQHRFFRPHTLHRPNVPYRTHTPNRPRVPYRPRVSYHSHSTHSIHSPHRRYRLPVFKYFRHGYRRYSYRYQKPKARPITRMQKITQKPPTTLKPLTTPQQTTSMQVSKETATSKPFTTPQQPTTIPKMTTSSKEAQPSTPTPRTPRKPTTTKPTTNVQPACHREGSTVVDKCHRVCTCRDGKLTDCYRVRKEFTQLTKNEKQRYLTALRFISTHEPHKTKYETLVTKHKILFNLVHNMTYFLPWHRWFLLQYENFLRQFDCKITVSYWDWALVSGSSFKNDFWDDTYGFGGNGVGSPPCVPTGPFSIVRNWNLPRGAGGGCLQRNFIPGIIPSIVQVAKVLAKNHSSFSDFELMVRVNLHDVVHYAIGGTMVTKDSASAPEFFLHHSFIDKIWTEWQEKSNFHLFHEFFLAQNTTMPGTKQRSIDVLNNNNLPGCVKVKYASAPLGNWGELIKDLNKMAEKNPVEVDNIPGMATANLNEKMFKVFNIREEERKRAMEMQENLKTKITVDTKKLNGKEKIIGLREADLKRMNDG